MFVYFTSFEQYDAISLPQKTPTYALFFLCFLIAECNITVLFQRVTSVSLMVLDIALFREEKGTTL